MVATCFEKDSITVPGILVDGNVFDLRSEMAVHAPTDDAYCSIDDLLADWDTAQRLLSQIPRHAIDFKHDAARLYPSHPIFW